MDCSSQEDLQLHLEEVQEDEATGGIPVDPMPSFPKSSSLLQLGAEAFSKRIGHLRRQSVLNARSGRVSSVSVM